MDRNGWNSHVNMQTQHKSESSKHYLDVNSIFDGKKFEPPNDSTKRLHKSISRKEMPNSRQDNERIPFPPTNCSRRSTHKAKNTFGWLQENAFSDVKDLHNERQSAPSTPNHMSFQEKVHVRQGESFHNEIPRKQDNEAPQTLRLEDNFSRNSEKNEGSSNFLYKDKDCLIPLKDQNGYDSIGSIRNSRNTYDDGSYGGGKNRPMTHKRSSECKITKVDGDHYDTGSYMRDRR